MSVKKIYRKRSVKKNNFRPADPAAEVLRPYNMPFATGHSLSTTIRLEKAGRFPARIRFSNGTVGWLRKDVEAWRQALKNSQIDISTNNVTEINQSLDLRNALTIEDMIEFSSLHDNKFCLNPICSICGCDYVTLTQIDFDGAPCLATRYCPNCSIMDDMDDSDTTSSSI